jgi:anti-sigma B factor antagonist
MGTVLVVMPNTTQFEVSDSVRPGVAVLDVRAEVDLATSPELHERLTELIATRPELLVVNLTDVTFMDSTGLGVLVTAVKGSRAAGGDLRLVVTHPQITKLLEVAGLDSVFSVWTEISEATRP